VTTYSHMYMNCGLTLKYSQVAYGVKELKMAVFNHPTVIRCNSPLMPVLSTYWKKPEYLGYGFAAPHCRSGPKNLPPVGANPWSHQFFVVDLETRGFCVFCVFLCLFIVDRVSLFSFCVCLVVCLSVLV